MVNWEDNKASIELTLHLNAQELKSVLIGSVNERPNRVESLRDTLDFPYKHKRHDSIISLEKLYKTMNKKKEKGWSKPL